MFKILFCLALLTIPSLCVTDGLDFGVKEGVITPAEWQCLRAAGKEFLIMQLWRSNGLLNPYYTINYYAAKLAGFKSVDAYAFICPAVNTPDQICDGIVKALPPDFSGRVYLDIEPWDPCWVGTQSERLQFAEEVATKCLQHGLDMGVYTCHWAWTEVFGQGDLKSEILNKLPLWYAHFDHIDVFDGDYATQKVSGWETAIIKQYEPDFKICGHVMDINVY